MKEYIGTKHIQAKPMKYRLIKLLGGYDVLLSRAEDALEKEKEARHAAQIELERLKEWRNKVAIKLRRAGIKESIINNLLKD